MTIRTLQLNLGSLGVSQSGWYRDPVTGEYYVLIESQGNNAPHTCCPTKIKDHLLPEN